MTISQRFCRKRSKPKQLYCELHQTCFLLPFSIYHKAFVFDAHPVATNCTLSKSPSTFPSITLLFFSLQPTHRRPLWLFVVNYSFILLLPVGSSWGSSRSARFCTSTSIARLTTSLLFCCWSLCWVSVRHLRRSISRPPYCQAISILYGDGKYGNYHTFRGFDRRRT